MGGTGIVPMAGPCWYHGVSALLDLVFPGLYGILLFWGYSIYFSQHF